MQNIDERYNAILFFWNLLLPHNANSYFDLFFLSLPPTLAEVTLCGEKMDKAV